MANQSVTKKEDFIDVYNKFYPLVYSTVYTKIGNVDDTKDICQEVFIRFYDRMEEIQNQRKWLYGTLRNVVLDFIKMKKPDAPEEDMDDLEVTYVNGFRDTRLIIQEAMENIDNFESEEERILFELVATHNFTYREAGRHVGMSERQAKYRYGLIVKRVVQYFNEKGIQNLEELL